MTAGRLTILQINDAHGYLEPHPELVWRGSEAAYPTLGGYARIAGLLKHVRAERAGAVVVLDNGDALHGTYPAVMSKGRAFVPVLNALALDAMTAHWEFAYGPAHLRALSQRLGFPILANNCYENDSGRLFFPPFRVLERGGLRLGIIGIAATIVDKGMPPAFSEGVRFTLGRDELPGQIAQLRRDEKVDLVIVLSHLGFPQDVRLASEVAGIDVLLSGHTHNRLAEPARVNGTLIIQSGCHGSFVGRLDLEVEAGTIAGCRHSLIAIDETIAPDAAMQAMVDAILAPDRDMLGEVLGHTRIGLNRSTGLETTMDNLLLDAIAAAAGTSLAFSNGWRYGAPVPPGRITRNDLWNMIPTDPPVSTVEITGEELRSMMEENLERTFSADPYAQMGGYVKRCRGVSIYAKIENPKHRRIEHFFVDGEAIDRRRTYVAAYVTMQAVPPQFGRNRHDLPLGAVAALEAYLRQHGVVQPDLRGTVVAI